MAKLSIDMNQFKNKFKVYSDNVEVFESIERNNGKFTTFNAERYTNWLLEFNIFYTLTV